MKTHASQSYQYTNDAMMVSRILNLDDTMVDSERPSDGDTSDSCASVHQITLNKTVEDMPKETLFLDPPTKKRKTKKKRTGRPGYHVRKEERAHLQEEAQRLEKQLEEIQRTIGIPTSTEHQTLGHSQHRIRTLWNQLRLHQLALRNMQSCFSRYMNIQPANQLSTFVHLTTDVQERHAALLKLRHERLYLGNWFVRERLRHIDPTRPFDIIEMHASDDGDFHYARCDIRQFEGLKSVKQMYDAVVSLLFKIEIPVTERLDQLTVREDIDCLDTRISNDRLVSSFGSDLVQEVNVVSFAEYYEHFDLEGGFEFAVISMDTVNIDDLYPYDPTSRVRKDVTTAIAISSFRRTNADGEDEFVVVLKRCAYLSIRKPDFKIDAAKLRQLQQSVPMWSDVMIRSLKKSLYGIAGTTPDQ